MRNTTRTILRRALYSFPLAALIPTTMLLAQPAPATQPDAPIAMEFPVEGVEIKTLIDIVTKRLRIPILYDADAVINKRVIVRVPVNVPESALLGILQSALRMKQLALVDADQPGWKQIVPATNLSIVAKPAAAGVMPEPGAAVTEILTPQHADPNRVLDAIRPFLTAQGGNASVVPGQKSIIISDYPSTMARIADIIKMVDTPGAKVEVRFVPLKQADAQIIAPIVTALVSARDGAAPTMAPGGVVATPLAGGSGLLVTPDERLNQLVVVAAADRMKEVVTLIEGLDKPIELQTKVYHFKSVAPERIDKLVKNLLGSSAKRTYQATVDRESQSLIASATADVHTRIEALEKELDIAVPESQSPIRFYKLKNTKAADVLGTISSLYGQSQDNGGGQPQFDTSTDQRTDQRRDIPADVTNPGSSMQNQSAAPQPRAGANPAPAANFLNGGGMSFPSQAAATNSSANPQVGGPNGTAPYNYNSSRANTGDLLGDNGGGPRAVHAPNATVAADANTNSIIVIAPPAVQQTYAELIRRLDERRPQVQIECTIVTMDTTDGSNFGVDISALGGFGASKLLTFSSFGVSTVNPSTGNLTPVAAQGGTAALLSPGAANIVIHALSTHSKARLVSAPQLLVNDNGKGKLQSVAQQPYAEIIDTTSVQARTSLGGQADAGTTISVEPHISQDDYLQLSYSVELSAFTGQSSAGLPPPSQKNTIDSSVTIPDGYTIVVGGLTQKNYTNALNSLPIIDQIPVLNLLFGSRSVQHQNTTLFVFIRPIILRDDKFDDLKYLSDNKARKAGLPGAYPVSEPIPLR